MSCTSPLSYSHSSEGQVNCSVRSGRFLYKTSEYLNPKQCSQRQIVLCLKKVRRTLTSILHVKVDWFKKILPTSYLPATLPYQTWHLCLQPQHSIILGCLTVKASVGRLANHGIIASYLLPRHVGCTHLTLQSKEGIHSSSSAAWAHDLCSRPPGQGGSAWWPRCQGWLTLSADGTLVQPQEHESSLAPGHCTTQGAGDLNTLGLWNYSKSAGMGNQCIRACAISPITTTSTTFSLLKQISCKELDWREASEPWT